MNWHNRVWLTIILFKIFIRDWTELDDGQYVSESKNFECFFMRLPMQEQLLNEIGCDEKAPENVLKDTAKDPANNIIITHW